MYIIETLYICDKNKNKYVTNVMEMSPSWEAASCAATQKFLNII
jgi:hypothetical protein